MCLSFFSKKYSYVYLESEGIVCVCFQFNISVFLEHQKYSLIKLTFLISQMKGKWSYKLWSEGGRQGVITNILYILVLYYNYNMNMDNEGNVHYPK